MSGNTSKENEQGQEEKTRSFIHVEFEDVGSAKFNFSVKDVTASQIAAIASYLEVYSQSFFSAQIAQSLQQKQEQQLSVPKPKIEIPK